MSNSSKKKPQKFAVIGLGSFGFSLATELAKQGAEVLAVDMDDRIVQEISDKVSHAVAFNCTDEKLLEAHGVADMDLVVVAIGEDFGANVMVTRILKDMGLPVNSRATTEREARILKASGADRVYTPERTQGEREARSITFRGVESYVPLVGGIDFAHIRPSSAEYNKTLRDLEFRRAWGLNVAYIGRLTAEGRRVYRVPLPDDEIQASDHLFVLGTQADIERYLAERE
ncbi:hypothetical protein GF402_07125 [Candidatus Fermentibacteria bacterium]|nr:hypothetical protein [Candidatus Fermentibacteria bacterium]